MKRNAEDTRNRLLQAAIAEFAAYGIAGARVDRIADEAQSNKAQIYNYFGNKDQLFDAVYDALVIEMIERVEFDALDLPDYAARLYDEHQAHPEVMRLTLWDLLERGGAGSQVPAVVQANQNKISAIQAAQREGVIADRLSAQELLTVIISIPVTAILTASEYKTETSENTMRRESIIEAVRRLITP